MSVEYESLPVTLQLALDDELEKFATTCPDCARDAYALETDNGRQLFSRVEGVRQLTLGTVSDEREYVLEQRPLAGVVVPHALVCLRLRQIEAARAAKKWKRRR